jgi:hypothetical protein
MSQQLRSEGLLCRTQLRENAEQYSGRPQSGGSRKGFDWRALLRIRWRRDDKESIICYFLFMALFVSDFSGLALVFPVVLYCYALLAQPPARTFWQVIILFLTAPSSLKTPEMQAPCDWDTHNVLLRLLLHRSCRYEAIM